MPLIFEMMTLIHKRLDNRTKMLDLKQHHLNPKNLANNTWMDKLQQCISMFKKIGFVSLPTSLHKLTLLWLSIFVLSMTYAQKVYPVRTSINVNYPSVFLSDYYKLGNTTVSVTLLDATAQDYKVKLKLDLTYGTQSYKSGFVEVTLTPHLPYTLSPQELQNLFSTVSPMPAVGGLLNEGVYQMKIIAYDAERSSIDVSNVNAGISVVPVVRFDPPMLNTLADKEKLSLQNAQNLFFTWTPRHLSIDPSIQVKYRLKIVKVPSGMNPYQAIATVDPTAGGGMETDLNAPIFVYGPNELQLQQGFICLADNSLRRFSDRRQCLTKI